MTHTYIGLFSQSKAAGEAVADLKEKGYTKDISLVAKDYKDDATTHQIKQDVKDGAGAGATAGAVMGAVTGLLVGAASFALPGVGFVVLGPLATTLAGAATGALTGGIVGTLVDMGIPDHEAKDYEHRIQNGEVLVAVTADEDKRAQIMDIYTRHGADKTSEGKKD